MTEYGKYARLATAAARALSSGPHADVEIYLPTSESEGPVLYRKSGVGLDTPDFDKLDEHGVPYVYVRSKDLGRCEAALESRLSALLRTNEIQVEEKTRIVHQVGTAVARDLTNGPVPSEDLHRAATLVDQVIGFVLDNPMVAGHMLQMAAHERTTASHMFVVSTLAIILGAEVFGDDYEMVSSLGLAGMMHDIGKLTIDPRILNKPTALTAEEALLIQQHPVESVRLLGDDPKASPAIRQIIVQHHEWVNGGGYPIGLTGEDLHPGSRVLSIVDSFHAMIGRRPYRAPMNPPDAVRVLNTQGGRQFDSKFLGYWNELFERFWSHDEKCLGLGTEDAPEEVASRHELRPVAQRRAQGVRRARRFACGGEIALKCVCTESLKVNMSADEFTAPVQDVSRSGACIFSSDPMYRGEVIHVQIEQRGQSLWVRGEVVWCRQHDLNVYRVGLKFLERETETEALEATGRASAAPQTGPPAVAPPSEVSAEDAPARSRPTAGISSEDALAKLNAMLAVRPLPPESTQTAVALLQSPDNRVRLKAVEVLRAVGTEPAKQALLQLSTDHDPEVRKRAIKQSGYSASSAISA